ncbi:MAG: prepilin-type N-terminal cleavage/methylation domain-containing protein [Sedimentisphaerales bacterium]|nr:prepilin-type N-terminal cleavage/methylation domain-containing protein [Sedimentisphaerales bacterium]
MSKTRKGFTLVELMVVILIVGILAAAAIPLMRGRIDSAKWSEANATAGTIRAAVRVYFAETGDNTTIIGQLSDAGIQGKLGFTSGDLTGTYFTAGDYQITAVSSTGVATVRVTGSQGNAPSGSKTLATDGTWQ